MIRPRLSLTNRATYRLPFRFPTSRLHSTSNVFKEGDTVVLRDVRDIDKIQLVREALLPDGSIHNQHGFVRFNDILGKQPTAIVTSTKGQRYSIIEPTLGQYTTETRRLVTPIYHDDANLIVSLLDLHPTAPPPEGEEDTEPKIQILEAGTGHGALTLHLARAVHAANPRCPRSESKDDAMRLWRERRRAVVHSIDISMKHSLHARKIVSNFKKGMYLQTVDFDVSPIRDWFAGRHETESFLTAAILDLPDSQHELAAVSQHVHVAGLVLLFMPSVTQIVEAQRQVVEQNLPLYLERVVEVGGGISGGRDWRVMLVKTRKSLRNEGRMRPVDGDCSSKLAAESNADQQEPDGRETETEPSGEQRSVCRPKPGAMIRGGGFIGLWRRVESRDDMGNSDSYFQKGLR